MSRTRAQSHRSFGLSVGGGFLVIGALAIWRGKPLLADITVGLGAALVITALLRPSLLRIPSLVWWKFAHALGWFNTRVLLGAVFFLIFAPVGIWWRLSGKDPMGRRQQTWPGWSARPERYRDKLHFTKRY